MANKKIKFKKGSDTYDVANRVRDYLLENGLDKYCDVMNELQSDVEIDVIVSGDEQNG